MQGVVRVVQIAGGADCRRRISSRGAIQVGLSVLRGERMLRGLACGLNLRISR